ncbi:hypothetical protein BJY01DRAFT_61365 [Aspergillus pseudoustus]|uniref:Uncharacterized protein n=1 Tax=Aspergillus pseudoustus TaxID=1810923 RepID=A0ABR4J7P3_9EURO
MGSREPCVTLYFGHHLFGLAVASFCEVHRQSTWDPVCWPLTRSIPILCDKVIASLHLILLEILHRNFFESFEQVLSFTNIGNKGNGGNYGVLRIIAVRHLDIHIVKKTGNWPIDWLPVHWAGYARTTEFCSACRLLIEVYY